MPEEQQTSKPSDKTWLQVLQEWQDKGGVSLNEGYCLLDNGLNAYNLFENGEQIQINCFLVPNFLFSSGRYSDGTAIYLQYGKDVQSLVIEDQLFDFGTKGHLIVSDTLGTLSGILEQFVCYDLVINIIHKLDDTRIMRFEPYIMSIVNIQDVAAPDPNTKLLRVDFEDLITAEAKKYSVGSLLKFDPSVKASKSFAEAFQKIFSYLSDILKKNAGGKLEYGKQLKFNNNTSTLDQNSLIEPIFDDIKPDDTIYNLIVALTKDACADIKMPEELTNDLEMIGNVQIPIFFKEEYPDIQNYYYILANEKPELIQEVDSNKEGIFIHRPYTLRNFYMPFQNAFNDGTQVVFESFTTAFAETNMQSTMQTINGVNPTPVHNIQSVTTNSNLTTKRWKNLVFISSSPQGGSNRLVFFNWIYEFFNKVFLKGRLSQQDIRLSNVTPGFYLAMQGDHSMMNDKDLAERNANIIIIRNEKADPLNEILMQIGKSIVSLVFLNNMYSFEVDGNLLRRPNEVINLYTPKDITAMNNNTIHTDFLNSDNVILYATGVIHKFEGNKFTDTVICNRIYEKVKQS